MLRRLRHFTFALAFAPLLAGRLLAQDADERYDFANGLADRGYFDLAEEQFDAIDKNAKTAEERASAQLGKATIKKNQIDYSAPEDRAKLVDEAIKVFDDFIKKNPKHERVAEAKFSVGDLYLTLGQSYIRQVQSVGEGETVDSVVKKATDQFVAAEKYFQELIDIYKKEEAAALATGDEAALELPRRNLMMAKYNYGVALFSHADGLKEAKGESPKGMLMQLTQAPGGIFEDFMWSYGDMIISFDVAVYLGRAEAELGNPDKAERWFDHAQGLITQPDWKAYSEIVQRSYVYEAKTFLQAAAGDSTKRDERLTKAMACIQDLKKNCPEARGAWWGNEGALVEAEILFLKKDGGSAIVVLQPLVNLAGYWNTQADNLLKRYGQGGGGPAFLTKLADQKVGRGDFLRAIRDYREILNSCRSKEEKENAAAHAWHMMGICYQELDRPFEAWLAFTQLLPFEKHKDFPDSMYARIIAAQNLTAFDASFDRYKQEAIADFNAKCTTDPRREDTIYLDGISKEQRGEFEGAARDYQVVSTTSPNYARALFGAGTCFQKAGDAKIDAARKETDPAAAAPLQDDAFRLFDQAAAALAKFQEFVKTDPKAAEISEQERNTRAGRLVAAKYFLAKGQESAMRIYADRLERSTDEAEKKELQKKVVDTAQKIVTALANFEKDHPENPTQVAITLNMRLQAMVKLVELGIDVDAHLATVEQFLDTLMNDYSTEKVVPPAMAAVANLFLQRSEQLKNEKKFQEAYPYFKKSALLFKQWVDRTGKLLNLDAVANMLLELAQREGEDPTYLNQAREMLERLIAKFDELEQVRGAAGFNEVEWRAQNGLTDVERWKVDWKLTEIYSRIGQFDAAAEKYRALLKENPQRGDIQETYAQLLVRWGGNLKDSDRAQAGQKFTEALGIYGKLILALDRDKQKEAYWRSNYNYIVCLEELGSESDVKRASSYLNRLAFETADEFDEDEFGYKTKFGEMKKRLQERTGG